MTGDFAGRLSAAIALFGVAAALLAGATLAGGLGDSAGRAGELRWSLVAVAIALAAANHAVRFVRWHILLERAAARPLDWGPGLGVFLAGSLLIFTPARAGEIGKSLYASARLHVAVAGSAPVLVVERLADLIVMSLLSALGLMALGASSGLGVAAAATGGVAAGVFLAVAVRRPPGDGWTWLPGRISRALRVAGASSARLSSPGRLPVLFGLGTLAWLIESAVYLAVLLALGEPLTPHLVLVAVAVWSLASLAGAISLLPAGLGVAEGGLAALGVALAGLSPGAAVAGAVIARAAVLGVVLLAGLAALGPLHLRRRRPGAGGPIARPG